jgi:hypothetical protein
MLLRGKFLFIDRLGSTREFRILNPALLRINVKGAACVAATPSTWALG